jgi:hypothetical protein
LLHFWAGPIPRNLMFSAWRSLSRSYVLTASRDGLNNC